MTRIARKKHHDGKLHIKKKYRSKRRTKDMDEIQHDMKPSNAEKLLNQEVDLDKPGLAQHYDIHCARYFINLEAMKKHFKSKQHKRRLKALEEAPYSQKEADAAAGLGTYKAPIKSKVVTQSVDEDVSMAEATG